jgi:2-keto-4-pentenoate hydratase/2-oxohepta-3-ene-1,7-dioic acid hydratase in catechol pathway
MRLARIASAAGVVHATPAADGAWQPVTDPYDALLLGIAPSPVGEPVADAVLLAPAAPTLIVGIAQPDAQGSPLGGWLKSPRSVVASGTEVIARRDAGRTVIEGEVAVVIGRDTAGLTAQNAHEYVLGVTAVNDVSSPDRAAIDVRNFEAKGGAGYTPLGPWIETEADLERTALTVAIDGEVRVETGSHELPASVAESLAYVAHWTPLGPGDIVMTGAPRSAFPVDIGPEGTLVEITVAGIPLVTRFR